MATQLPRLALLRARPRPFLSPACRLVRLASSSAAAASAPPPPPPPPPPSEPPARPDRPYSPYAAKKVWPPDFARLSPQEQLRFEKRFKRRVALRSARPRWVRFVKLAQLFSVTFVVIYCVLFMEWEYGPQPFDPVRKWFWDTLDTLRGGQRNAVRLPGDGGRGGNGSDAARSR